MVQRKCSRVQKERKPWTKKIREKEGSGPDRTGNCPGGVDQANTDAGCCLYSGEASSGVVVRDENGDVLLLAWKPLRFVADVEEAEAEACLHGLKLVATRFRKPACVESDCAVLIKAINEKEEDRSKWAGIIKEIQSFRPCSQAACLAIQSAKPIRWCMH
jgi:ribonuclease HI